jgi:hypothetical protein
MVNLSRRLVLLLVAAFLVVVMAVVTAGPVFAAQCAPSICGTSGGFSTGAGHANPNAAKGISTSSGHVIGCQIGCG